MRLKPVALSTIVLLSLAGGGWYLQQHKKPSPGADSAAPASPASAASGAAGSSSSKSPPQTVGVMAARLQDVPVTVEASGTVASLKTVDLRAQTSSVVREVLIKDGDTVRRGQVLFRFDDRPDRANVERARAQLARDRASLADAERQYKRAQELRAQNFIAPSALDSSQAAVEAQRAAVQADEAALRTAELSLGYNELRAPMDGRVGLISVNPGSLVQGGSAAATPLLSIVQMNPIGVSFNLPESQLASLLAATRAAPGEKNPPALDAQLLMPGARGGSDQAAKEQPLKGKLGFVDNLVDSSTGTIKVRAEFDNSQQTLWPGQYVRIRMTLRTIKDAVVVPQAAIIQRGNERSVYVVGADKAAEMRPVQTRYPFGDWIVVEGLKAGDSVVVEGKQNLRPGTPLKPQPAQLNPAQGGGKRGAAAAAAASGVPASASAASAAGA
ncbi:efflux RND transporter periplasmic adaptor subunit [Paucibacter sp. DJ2R-2]|uniref:efflux RND transporter periplasmic adaptor subunit n=1 Tax=Paucibacter sp. DJ2R-2 TaxID=2893558 RepID=UPI0021E3D119|nr:efflux RND transporter periplasmic adaptor subunit [Paucibacter sp. DJ2R-2]MCV2420942.1 efflux RND transporter periplasmic adaptor subunit [Paucibacter sp. DJ4R-1]MCV2438920.1 efflux RND transporter periplasmic adaptor subunit [Paucibacter sp. DJ2R-2]